MGNKKEKKGSLVISILWLIVGIIIIYILYKTCEVFLGNSLKIF